jgi:hypothetical protein
MLGLSSITRYERQGPWGDPERKQRWAELLLARVAWIALANLKLACEIPVANGRSSSQPAIPPIMMARCDPAYRRLSHGSSAPCTNRLSRTCYDR